MCLLFLLVVAVSFFAPMLFGGKGLQGPDSMSWQANSETLKAYEKSLGEWPLWAPHIFGGMPTYLIGYSPAVPQLDTVINLIKPVAWPASHLFLLFSGVYCLLYYLTRNHVSGLLSAVAFGMTTYVPIILAVGHNTKFRALAYAPFVLLAFVYTLRNPSVLGGLLFAGILSLDLRAKHPQITYYVLTFLLVWWMTEFVRAWRTDDLVPFAKGTGWLAMGTGLALLMVAQPYLGIYEYKQYSVRGGGGSGGGGGGGMAWTKAMQWSQGPKELLTLVIAEAFGGGGRTYWGPKAFTEGPHYIGGVATALAGLAVCRVRSWLTWGVAAGTAATMLFALGKYASWINWPMFEVFPFFSAFRAPETWLVATVLGVAVLAGIGLDYVLRWDDESENGKTRAIVYAFGTVAGAVLLLLVGRGVFFDFESPRETRVVKQIEQRPNLTRSNPKIRSFYQRLERRKETRRAAFQADAMRTLFAVTAVFLLLWLYRRRTLTGWVAGGVIVLVVLIDLWGVDRRYLGEEQFEPKTAQQKSIPMYPHDRFVKEKVQEADGPGHFRVLPLKTPQGSNPTSNAIPSYHYQSIGGYHAAKLGIYQEYLDHILQLSSKQGPTENGLDLMNTRYVVAKQKLPGTTVSFKDSRTGMLVLENPDAVPRGFLVGSTEVVSDKQRLWKRLRSPEFEPRSTVLLSEPLDAPVRPIDSSSTAEVTMESFSAEEIRWTIQTDAPRLFVASEVYYPRGWHAYLDGKQVPIHRVDYLLRGVHVPEGEHTLVMRFEPKADRYGTWISGIATALVYGGILGIGGWTYRRRRRGDHGDDETTDERT
ncbi:MAG: hypothetical protein BRD55_09500 [Bacteroidetes bacterium SW_9_63_38]|nr:MAG: hypothetical protein BRD55_09500 [Bacteroidetes bacterium SW_9_63_38]